MSDPDPSSSPTPRSSSGGVLSFFDWRRWFGRPAAAEAPALPTTGASAELIHQAMAFQSLRVADVMKPRANIVALDRSATFSEIVARFVEAEHSRMPVYKDHLDEPVGVVHVKDVFKLLARKTRKPGPDDQILSGRHALVRKVLYVPPFMGAAELLALMRARRTHMALVIDEFGGTDGLVTLEDLLETLVGAIDDEHDDADGQGFTPIAEDAQGWIVDARAPLTELEAALGEGVDLAPPDVDDEIDTVGGLLNALTGRVPQRSETVALPDGFLAEVLAADPRRVKRVRVRRTDAHATEL